MSGRRLLVVFDGYTCLGYQLSPQLSNCVFLLDFILFVQLGPRPWSNNRKQHPYWLSHPQNYLFFLLPSRCLSPISYVLCCVYCYVGDVLKSILFDFYLLLSLSLYHFFNTVLLFIAISF